MSDSLNLLSKIMDCTAVRQRVLANNLANANTPNYKRMDVEFKGTLEAAMKSQGVDRVNEAKPTIYEDLQSPARGDGNNVSLQTEMSEMTENALLYQFAGKGVTYNLDMLRKAIKGQ